MPITKLWLLNRPKRFWSDLFLIIHLSPYFGKLRWSYLPIISGTELTKIDEEIITSLQQAINQLPDNPVEEQVISGLMQALFRVPPNYVRTTERDRQEGLEPIYPGYYVSPASENYRPIKQEEIQPEDIRMFKKKLAVLTNSLVERLITERKTTLIKINLVLNKLTQWTKLVSKTNL